MTKSLGQIAYEVAYPPDGPFIEWERLGLSRPRWEAAAQAVRAAVLEEAALKCEELGTEYWGPADNMDPDCEYLECAQAIRSLK